METATPNAFQWRQLRLVKQIPELQYIYNLDMYWRKQEINDDFVTFVHRAYHSIIIILRVIPEASKVSQWGKSSFVLWNKRLEQKETTYSWILYYISQYFFQPPFIARKRINIYFLKLILKLSGAFGNNTIMILTNNFF